MKIAPSMLACDFSQMGNEIKEVNNSDYIHLDVMDGNFVPNISFGPAVIKSLKKHSDIPFDVHLMINNPNRYINDFFKAGADIITFHLEAENNIEQAIDLINNNGIKAGLAVKPNTPIEEVFPFLNKLYLVLIMTVEPGFGGQAFMPEMMEKVRVLKKEILKRKLSTLIQVDGGINLNTVNTASENGVDICVAGTCIFKSSNPKQTVKILQEV